MNASGRSNSSMSGFLNSVNKRNKQVEDEETSPKVAAKNLSLDMIGKTFPHDQSYTEIQSALNLAPVLHFTPQDQNLFLELSREIQIAPTTTLQDFALRNLIM